MGWLASDSALYILGALTVVDLAGDKIPLVDHAMHAVHVFFKPVAGAIAAAAVMPGADDPVMIAFMLLGGGNALAVHGLDASARVASTATTTGLANPILSLIGDTATAVVRSSSRWSRRSLWRRSCSSNDPGRTDLAQSARRASG